LTGQRTEEGRVNQRELDTLDRTTLVNELANVAHDTTESTLSDRDLDWGTSINDLLTMDETFCTAHGNGSDRVLCFRSPLPLLWNCEGFHNWRFATTSRP
jgi:hypothetical protein